MNLNRRSFMASAAVAALCGTVSAATAAPALPNVTVYKSPSCGCCHLWVEHMRKEGFRMKVVDLPDLTEQHAKFEVPAEFTGCHVAEVDGYFIEGHVPAREIRRLLSERPAGARGLAVPGMPLGSPGMEYGSRRDPYEVVLLSSGNKTSVFARYPG